jgi:hypothetical protein
LRVGDLAIKNAAGSKYMADGVFELGTCNPPVKVSSAMGGLGSGAQRIISGPRGPFSKTKNRHELAADFQTSLSVFHSRFPRMKIPSKPMTKCPTNSKPQKNHPRNSRRGHPWWSTQMTAATSASSGGL